MLTCIHIIRNSVKYNLKIRVKNLRNPINPRKSVICGVLAQMRCAFRQNSQKCFSDVCDKTFYSLILNYVIIQEYLVGNIGNTEELETKRKW